MNLLIVLLLGTIDITSGSLEIEKVGGKMKYFLKNGVTLTFDSTVVTADEGIYFIDEKWGKLYGHVRLKTPSYSVNADSLIYFEEGNRTVFRLNVSGMDSTALFEAKDVVVKGDTACASGEVNIFIVNDSINFSGDSAVYFLNLKKGKLFGNAEAHLIDTVKLKSDSLGFKKDTLLAWGNVSITSKKFTGKSLELEYSRNGESSAKVTLIGNSVFEAGETHVEGDTLEFELSGGEVRFATFKGSPVMRTNRDSGYLVVESDTMQVEMQGDSLVFFEATGSVRGEFVENE